MVKTLPSRSVAQLPIHFILSNNTAVTYFADFLASVGGQALIDCYLAVKVNNLYKIRCNEV